MKDDIKKIFPAPRPRLPNHQRVLLALGVGLLGLMIVDGRRGTMLRLMADRGEIVRSSSARGVAVFVWGGGGYQGGK